MLDIILLNKIVMNNVLFSNPRRMFLLDIDLILYVYFIISVHNYIFKKYVPSIES